MKVAKTVAHVDSDIICMFLEPRVGRRGGPRVTGRVECRREPHPPPGCSRPGSMV